MNSGRSLYDRARTLIPGGTQLLSKRPEMFDPGQWPSYYERAEGATIQDLDGQRFLDFTHCGVGSCPLGYAHEAVNEAVREAVSRGSMTTLNDPREVHLAEELLERHPWADGVRYARTGGESMALAVRLARAASGRDGVAVCGYHGWHDWYLAANLTGRDQLEDHLLPGLDPAGVPASLEGTVFPFEYNDVEALRQIVRQREDDLAAIVLEPVRNHEPEEGFLESVRRLADRAGAVLVVDEITAGFRLGNGGAHRRYGLTPDVAVFAKGISNGFPMGAVIGVRGVMDAAQDSFVSSTYWSEGIGPAAALATLREHGRQDLVSHLKTIGERVQSIWREADDEFALSLTVEGVAPLSHFEFDDADGTVLRTLFTRQMLERGFLASDSFYPMLAHTAEDVARYREALFETFDVLVRAQQSEDPADWFDGEPAHSGFERLN